MPKTDFLWDADFLLTVGSFLLAVELFYLQLCFGVFFAASLLTVGAFLLTVEAFCLQWESASSSATQRTVSQEAQL